jgi:hypothetical protein
VQGLPDGQPLVGAGVPVGGVLGRAEEADLAAAALDDAGLDQAADAGGLRAGENVGFAVDPGLPAVLLEPPQAKLGVGVEVVLGVPSASRTAEYLEKTAMPGPMIA